MKKILMMVALVATSVAASAQVYIGGGLGVNSSKDASWDGTDNPTTTTLTIMPEIGYNLDDQWTVGIGLGFGYSKVEDAASTTTFAIAPYGRYHFARWGNVAMFIQGGLTYEYANVSPEGDGADTKASAFEIGFKPGINVGLTDKLSFVATLGNLGWSTIMPDSDNAKNSSEFDFGVDLTNVTFSLYYSF